jgi:hypothetical protein
VDTYGPAELFRVDVNDGKAGKVTKLHPSRSLVLADAIRPLGGNAFLLIEGGGRLDRMVVKGEDVAIETLKDGFDVPTGVAIVGKTAWVPVGQLSTRLQNCHSMSTRFRYCCADLTRHLF